MNVEQWRWRTQSSVVAVVVVVVVVITVIVSRGRQTSFGQVRGGWRSALGSSCHGTVEKFLVEGAPRSTSGTGGHHWRRRQLLDFGAAVGRLCLSSGSLQPIRYARENNDVLYIRAPVAVVRAPGYGLKLHSYRLFFFLLSSAGVVLRCVSDIAVARAIEILVILAVRRAIRRVRSREY